MHNKRQVVPSFWPIPRKGNAYVAVPSHNNKVGVPLVTLLRDVLHLVRNTKELQRAMREKRVFVNHHEVYTPQYAIAWGDIVSFPSIKKYYRAMFSPTLKLVLEEIAEKDAHTITLKVKSKKTLRSGKTQLLLMYGHTIISTEPVATGDSVVFNLTTKKIEKVIPLKEGKTAFVLLGKNIGSEGKISRIFIEGGKKMVQLATSTGEIRVWVKNIIVLH